MFKTTCYSFQFLRK